MAVKHFRDESNPGYGLCGKPFKSSSKLWRYITCKKCLKYKPAPKSTANTRKEKSKYTPKFIPVVKALASDGHIPSYIAGVLGVAESTFRNWLKLYPELREAFEAGRNSADSKVERALYERALGYEHKETKVFSYKGGIVKEDVTKFYPPSETAASFWLTNRKPDKWKNRQENINKNLDVDGVDIQIIE